MKANTKQRLLIIIAAMPIISYGIGKLGQGLLISFGVSVVSGYILAQWVLREELDLIDRYGPAATALADAADALRRVA